MAGRFYWRGLVTLFLGLIAFTQPDSRVSGQEPNEQVRLRLAADAMNNQSRMIAVGISSLANLEIETFDIDVVWTGIQDTPLDLIRKKQNELGLVDASKTDLAELKAMAGLHAVMKLWPADENQEQSQAAAHPGHLLVASASVKPDFIHQFLDLVQNESFILKAAHIDLDKIGPSFSLLDLPLTHHQGVHDFLKANDIELAAISAPVREEEVDPTADQPAKNEKVSSSLPSAEDGSRVKETLGASALPVEDADQNPLANAGESGKSFTLLFETDSAELHPDDIRSVAAACRYAATLPRARFIISGHTDTVGSTRYNNKLARSRAESVADAIRNDPRFRESLSVMEYGESNLAVATDDNVPEAKNRRVKLTIVEER